MDDTTNKSYKFDDFEQEANSSDSEISNENPFPEEFDSKDVVNREEEVDENNPFGEEFSKADVVNKDSLEKKSIPPLTPEDIEKLIAYDEQKRLQRNFLFIRIIYHIFLKKKRAFLFLFTWLSAE